MYTDVLTDLIITKIISVNTIYTEGDMRKRRMDRNRWAVLQKYEGETEYYMNGKTFVSNRTHMVILPKGTSYDWQCKKSGHYSILEFDSDKEYGEIMTFEITEKSADKILRCLKELEYKRTAKSPLCELECMRGTYEIILRLAESTPKAYIPSERLGKIKPAAEYIAKHYDRQITNDSLAQMCGISTVYFRKLFTEAFGMSPINYVHSIRIKKAKEMLEIDYSSITNIALSLGYPSIYDFSRAFKKLTGVSPKKYARNGKSSDR